MTPDVNVVLAAARPDHPHHRTALDWFESTLSDRESLGVTLLPMVVSGFLRIVTNRKVFPQPSSPDEAVDFIDQLLALPAVTMLPLGPEWPRLRRLCVDQQLAGNDLTDAWIAAAVEQHTEHLVTFDKGFRRLLPRSRVTVLKAG